MSDSETSLNMDIIDNKGKINNKSETKKSSDTDYYMNMLANSNKTVPVKQELTTESEIINSDSDYSKKSDKSSSSNSSKSRKSNSSHNKSEQNNQSTKVNNTNSSRNHDHKNSDNNNSDNSDHDNHKSDNHKSDNHKSDKHKSDKHKSDNHKSDKHKSDNHKSDKHKSDNHKSDNSDYEQSSPVVSRTEPIQLTQQESRIKKIELLRKLSEIKLKGFSLTKEYDFNSSIEEMEYEFALLKSFVDKRNGVKIFKSGLLQTVSIIEFLNDKYDPFDFHLQGWGEHLSIEVDSYDDILEELYEKYKGTGKGMPPEVKLLLLISASAGAFHFSKSHSSIPGLEQTLSRNPELVSKLLNPQKPQSQFMSPQELNIQNQRVLLQQKEKELKQKHNNNVSFTTPLQPNKPILEPSASNESSNKLHKNGVPEIRAPSNVQDILNRIKQSQANIGATDTQDETSSNNDRIVSDINVSDGTVSESKKGRKPKTTPAIYISTK